MRPIIFLDFDDVICLNNPYGGYHAKQALEQGTLSSLSDLLFDLQAIQNLKSIHQQFNPLYVLSTSWSMIFEKNHLMTVLKYCGVDYVANALHPAWTTPKAHSHGIRAAEIRIWLKTYPEWADRWVVIDDEISGTGFRYWPQRDLAYVVLCQHSVGLQKTESNKLARILELRTNTPTNQV